MALCILNQLNMLANIGVIFDSNFNFQQNMPFAAFYVVSKVA